jgi:hypothetical protein
MVKCVHENSKIVVLRGGTDQVYPRRGPATDHLFKGRFRNVTSSEPGYDNRQRRWIALTVTVSSIADAAVDGHQPVGSATTIRQ